MRCRVHLCVLLLLALCAPQGLSAAKLSLEPFSSKVPSVTIPSKFDLQYSPRSRDLDFTTGHRAPRPEWEIRRQVDIGADLPAARLEMQPVRPRGGDSSPLVSKPVVEPAKSMWQKLGDDLKDEAQDFLIEQGLELLLSDEEKEEGTSSMGPQPSLEEVLRRFQARGVTLAEAQQVLNNVRVPATMRTIMFSLDQDSNPCDHLSSHAQAGRDVLSYAQWDLMIPVNALAYSWRSCNTRPRDSCLIQGGINDQGLEFHRQIIPSPTSNGKCVSTALWHAVGICDSTTARLTACHGSSTQPTPQCVSHQSAPTCGGRSNWFEMMLPEGRSPCSDVALADLCAFKDADGEAKVRDGILEILRKKDIEASVCMVEVPLGSDERCPLAEVANLQPAQERIATTWARVAAPPDKPTTGKTVGISVGTVVGVVAILGLLWWLCKDKKKKDVM